jgi:hypothetical protein
MGRALLGYSETKTYEVACPWVSLILKRKVDDVIVQEAKRKKGSHYNGFCNIVIPVTVLFQPLALLINRIWTAS